MKKTKLDKVKAHLLKKGKITSWEAISKYSFTRLAAYIFKLRNQGWNIISENKTKNGLNWTEYRLNK